MMKRRRPLQRLSGQQLEEAIEKIEDENARDAVYELLLRARNANEELKERVAKLEASVKQPMR